MATHKQMLLYCFIALNVTLMIMNTPAWQNFWGHNNKMTIQTLTLLNTTTNLRGNRVNELISGDSLDRNLTEDQTSVQLFDQNNEVANSTDLLNQNKTENQTSIPPVEQAYESISEDSLNSNTTGNQTSVHPFDQLSLKLEQLDWDPLRIDEYVRNYWDAEKSFIRYYINRHKVNTTILSTSCLHTAAWVITGLLGLEKRSNNIYYGLYKRPRNRDLIVYDNTETESPLAAPVTQSIRNFVNSRPSNESIYLQVDMYEQQTEPSPYYVDHHFALHFYEGQVSLYHTWQDTFDLIEWMKEPQMFKLRYPMPIETFLADLEKSLTYTEEETEKIERYEALWRLFGITEKLTYNSRGKPQDPNVGYLKYPWVVSLITHWPNLPTTESN